MTERAAIGLGGMGATLLLALLLVSCEANPFGLNRDAYAGSNEFLPLGSGWHFDLESRVARDDRETDFAFYTINNNYYLGCGWETGTGAPGTKTIADLDRTYGEFDLLSTPPAYSSYRGQVLITADTLTNRGLFSIYTRDGRYALIGVERLETNGPVGIRFRYVYNPRSDDTFNRSYYGLR